MLSGICSGQTLDPDPRIWRGTPSTSVIPSFVLILLYITNSPPHTRRKAWDLTASLLLGTRSLRFHAYELQKMKQMGILS